MALASIGEEGTVPIGHDKKFLKRNTKVYITPRFSVRGDGPQGLRANGKILFSGVSNKA
jgi:hypothetical protein